MTSSDHPMLYLLYSADYELYLGSNLLAEEEVLIQPTNLLLATCQRLEIPITLFADVACLWRYRELGKDRFPDMAELQLQEAIRQGHDVQTHLHPHWAATTFQGAECRFDPATYLLGTLHPDPALRARMTASLLQRAARHLTDLLSPIDPDYRCLAFRAGGYGLQPDTAMILNALLTCGYRIDSSIIPGLRLANPMQRVDFSQVPDLPNWWLSPEGGLTSPAAPGTPAILEIPIPACHLSDRERLAIRIPEALRAAWETLRGPPPPRGTPCNAAGPACSTANRCKTAYWRMRAILAQRFQRLELGNSPGALSACLHRYLKECKPSRQPVMVSLNCHPKGLRPAHLATLERFHDTLLTHWKEKVRAITFQQAWRLARGRPVPPGAS
ncbi:MAG: hypothetical protein HQL96_02990 [Magnetococcales bacterium]|nr:hypothetical protein [Magnetococcales bacterium]